MCRFLVALRASTINHPMAPRRAVANVVSRALLLVSAATDIFCHSLGADAAGAEEKITPDAL